MAKALLAIWALWLFMPIWSGIKDPSDEVIRGWVRLLLIVLTASFIAAVLKFWEKSLH